jgi:pimeloyl-ACP methyl ester carboxylesterase
MEQPERCQEMVDRTGSLSGPEMWAGLQQCAGMFGYDRGRHRILERLERKARLLMVGDQDILAPIENVREHPLFLEGPTLVFRQAGHRFFYEDAQPFNEIAHHFLGDGSLPEPLPGRGIVQRLEVSA